MLGCEPKDRCVVIIGFQKNAQDQMSAKVVGGGNCNYNAGLGARGGCEKLKSSNDDEGVRRREKRIPTTNMLWEKTHIYIYIQYKNGK